MTSPLVLGSWLITYFTRSLLGLYMARIIQGVAIGIVITIVPIFLAEIAEPRIRGELGGHLQTTWYIGTLFAYCTGPFLSYSNYILTSSIPAFLFLACFIMVPETPYFYMMIGQKQKAEKSLSWYRGDSEVKWELESIGDSLKESEKKESLLAGWKALFSKECRKALGMITLIFVIRSIGGTTVVTSFATKTFSKSVSDERHADYITIGMGVVLTCTTLCSTLVADSFGRKPLMVLSTLGLGLSNSIIATYYYLERETTVDTSSFFWLLYLGYISYCMTYNLAIGPIGPTLQAEYFSSHVRAAAGAYVTIMGNIIRFGGIKQYQILEDNIGVYSNFVVYSVVPFAGLIFVILFMEETANKSLGEIHNKELSPWGRKIALLLTFPLVLSSWIITTLTRSVVFSFIARILQGTAIGFFFTAGPPYLAEIAQADKRGELCGHLQTMWFTGVLYAYCTGPFMSYESYTYVSSIPALLFFITFINMPESPYFLLMKSDTQSALKSLSWLRGDENVLEEFKSMCDAVEREQNELKGGWKDLLTAQSCRKPLFIMTVFGIVKYLGGTATIQNFITQTFAKNTGGQIPPEYISIAMGVVLLVATVVAAFVADTLGRRFLVLWSTFLVAISSAVLAIFFFFDRETSIDTSGMDWISYAGFVVYCIGLNIGLGPLQTTLQAEYFPSNLRSPAGVWCNVLRNVLLFSSIKQYQLFDDNFGVYTNFTFYAVVSFVGLYILYRYMDETANKSLGEIQSDTKPNKDVCKA